MPGRILDIRRGIHRPLVLEGPSMDRHAIVRRLVRCSLTFWEFLSRLKGFLTTHAYVVACIGGTAALVLASVGFLYVDAGLGFYRVVPVFKDLDLLPGVNTSMSAGVSLIFGGSELSIFINHRSLAGIWPPNR